jgi:hypothetical protein
MSGTKVQQDRYLGRYLFMHVGDRLALIGCFRVGWAGVVDDVRSQMYGRAFAGTCLSHSMFRLTGSGDKDTTIHVELQVASKSRSSTI